RRRPHRVAVPRREGAGGEGTPGDRHDGAGRAIAADHPDAAGLQRRRRGSGARDRGRQGTRFRAGPGRRSAAGGARASRGRHAPVARGPRGRGGGGMNPETTGAARLPGGIPPGAAGADLEFYRLAERYLSELFEAFPSASTAAGFHRYDERLDDWSGGGVRAKIAMARGHQASLRAFDAARLTPGARVDLSILRNDADSTLLSLEELRPHERDPQFFVDLLGNSLLYL